MSWFPEDACYGFPPWVIVCAVGEDRIEQSQHVWSKTWAVLEYYIGYFVWAQRFVGAEFCNRFMKLVIYDFCPGCGRLWIVEAWRDS